LAALLIAPLCATSLRAGTPAQEKAFVDKYKAAFEAGDKATLQSFLYTQGANPMALEFYKMMLENQRRAYGLGGPPLFMKGVNRSIGTGRNVVVLCSLAISRMVCRNRSCSAIGSLLIIAAACTIFSAA
jgi:hypothetical protein